MTAKRFLTEDDKTGLEKDVAAANAAASSAASVAKGASTTAQEAIDLARAGTNIRTYTNLEQIGMSSNDFSSSDFKANIVKLADYFDGKNFLFQMFIEKGKPASWYNSISSKLSNDLSVTLGAADNLQVFIRGMVSDSTDTGVILIDVVSDGYASNGVVFSCSFTRSLLGDDVSKFIYTQHAPRKFSVNLASETEAVYNGSSDVSMGVSGMLPLSHGGTGGHTAELARRNLGITPDNIGAVPTTRKVNGYELNADISLSASDVGAPSVGEHNIKTYTELSQLNLDQSIFSDSTTDFDANLSTIINAMPYKSQLSFGASGVNNKFISSLISRLVFDGVVGSMANDTFLDVYITKHGSELATAKIEVTPDSVSRNAIWLSYYDKNSNGVMSVRPFIEIYNKAGFLPLDHITSGTTDIGAGSAMSSLIHIVYED